MTERSHVTQVMQNYLDSSDVRTRANPTALEAQLLNMAGIELESLIARINRETNQTLQTVPANIDNSGVYYATPVPNTIPLVADQTTFDAVVTTSDGVITSLAVFDDNLPIPTRIEIDSPNVVELDNPLLFTVNGDGDDLGQAYAVQYVAPGSFPVPNVLTLWTDNSGLNGINAKLTIIGTIYPEPAWVAERKKTTEVLNITDTGVTITRNRWSSIDSIAIRNLPVGVTLRGWSMPFNLPACPDLGRPFTTVDDRDILYNRYWQVANGENLLYEMYGAGEIVGLQACNSYSFTDQISDIAVEPFTNGMYMANDTTIIYVDRREYQADLSTTGLMQEPLFGLQVEYDFSRPGPTRYVTLSGTPYANSANISQYRYTVTPNDSLNALYSILPNGALGPANAGWRTGDPQTVSFALLSSTDYEFKLEMQDINGITTYDVLPFHNAAITPLQTIDLSSVIDTIVGIAFDSYGQLWVWNGSFAIPLLIHYAAYIFDDDSGVLFATDPFDSVTIS